MQIQNGEDSGGIPTLTSTKARVYVQRDQQAQLDGRIRFCDEDTRDRAADEQQAAEGDVVPQEQ